MSDLKPCPFCNGTHSINVINFFTGDSFRKCDICGAEAPEAKTPKEAAKVWNTRPAEDAKDREIEKLKAEITRYRRAVFSLSGQSKQSTTPVKCRDITKKEKENVVFLLFIKS